MPLEHPAHLGLIPVDAVNPGGLENNGLKVVPVPYVTAVDATPGQNIVVLR